VAATEFNSAQSLFEVEARSQGSKSNFRMIP
jgi:hypothetical protein